MIITDYPEKLGMILDIQDGLFYPALSILPNLEYPVSDSVGTETTNPKIFRVAIKTFGRNLHFLVDILLIHQ